MSGLLKKAACYTPYFSTSTSVVGSCCNAHGNDTVQIAIIQVTCPDADIGHNLRLKTVSVSKVVVGSRLTRGF
jgi:hypothetical protein